MTDVTAALARFIVDSRPDDIPAGVRHETARAIVNWTGCAVGGAGHETITRALTAIAPFQGPPQATVFGRDKRLDAPHAALINGMSSHLLDFDDTHARAVHPSAPVLPALFAFSEWQKTSGADLVHAFALGVEAECRIGLSVFPEHHDLGWHITGTAGVFGAATAIGKLLKLSAQQMTWALGIAATQAAGLQEVFGSMSKSLHPGKAAQNGFMAAMLASQGFTCTEQGIEGERGFGRVLSTHFDADVITAELGQHYELSRNMYKPYACGLVVHAVIDACIALREQYKLLPDDIDSIALLVSPRTMQMTNHPKPLTGLEGKFSVQHVAAAAIVFGGIGEAQFSDSSVLDPRVIAVRERITVTVNEKLSRTQANVRIRLGNGREIEHHVAHALGTTGRPMGDCDLNTKFHGLVDDVLGANQSGDLLDQCWSIATIDDAGRIARTAATSTPRI